MKWGDGKRRGGLGGGGGGKAGRGQQLHQLHEMHRTVSVVVVAESEPYQSRLVTRPPEGFGNSSPPLRTAYTTPSEEGLNKC